MQSFACFFGEDWLDWVGAKWIIISNFEHEKTFNVRRSRRPCHLNDQNLLITLKTGKMKKTLTLFLALVVSMMALQASAAMYIVGSEPFGGWKPADGVAMTSNGNGTYSYTATLSLSLIHI